MCKGDAKTQHHHHHQTTPFDAHSNAIQCTRPHNAHAPANAIRLSGASMAFISVSPRALVAVVVVVVSLLIAGAQ